MYCPKCGKDLNNDAKFCTNCGYQIVKDMTDKERDDILKYNIGPDQIKDLPDIKKFLKLNKFKSLI